VHHTDIGDGHNAGHKVILMISIVICRDMQDVGRGGGVARECQKTKEDYEEKT